MLTKQLYILSVTVKLFCMHACGYETFPPSAVESRQYTGAFPWLRSMLPRGKCQVHSPAFSCMITKQIFSKHPELDSVQVKNMVTKHFIGRMFPGSQLGRSACGYEAHGQTTSPSCSHCSWDTDYEALCHCTLRLDDPCTEAQGYDAFRCTLKKPRNPRMHDTRRAHTHAHTRGTYLCDRGTIPCIICDPSSLEGMRTVRTMLPYSLVGETLDSP